jgi:hypothetical protein
MWCDIGHWDKEIGLAQIIAVFLVEGGAVSPSSQYHHFLPSFGAIRIDANIGISTL